MAMWVEHLEYLFLVFFLYSNTCVLHYEYYLLLNGIIVDIDEDMPLLCVFNGIRYHV